MEKKKIIWIPKSGPVAGAMNLVRINEYIEKNPDANGVEIAKALGLSKSTVYSHLKKFR